MEHENRGIVMIPIDALAHHPDNPRKDLGDLKELTASIKASGIMQNLTVVPKPREVGQRPTNDSDCSQSQSVASTREGEGWPEHEETWLVVIGNRRLEASKAAGLTELPCVISDMDYKTQLATMMAENMQRIDLTLTEQAQGVQLMMDLGMDVGEISKRTGMRKDAIQRRAIMAKYDTAKAAAAVVRGGTIGDFMELEKLPEAERDAMLEFVGTPSLKQRIRDKLDELKQAKYRQKVIDWLETFATEVEKQGYVGTKVVHMRYVNAWYRFTQAEVDKLKLPDDVKDRHYYYKVDRVYNSIKLLAEIDTREEDKERLLREKKSAYVEQRSAQANALDEKFRQMRYEFLFSGADIVWNETAILRAYVLVLAKGCWHSTFPDGVKEQTEQLTGLAMKGNGYASRPELGDMLGLPDHKMRQVGAGLLWGAVDRDIYKPWVRSYDKSCIEFQRSTVYEIIYDMLLGMGYEMSDEEADYLGGTHEVYKPFEEVEG